MYEYIKGEIALISTEYIVVDHQGIGYQLFMPNPFVMSQKQGQTAQIYTYQHVREDQLTLFGFPSMEEKLLFMKLLNVSGIGPKGALAILASGAPEQVIEAIENENDTFLTKFPGVGKKTARQMILDLKGKLQDVVPDYFPNLFTDPKSSLASDKKELEEAILALKALGYSEREVKKVEPALRKEALTTDEYIKKGLRLMLKLS
ncbi:Holliday junction branch migration protein RuvA [Jeotgalibacillus proteolyticus]|uniref:Holliday junction branch migration complex subunit RuvA n=1 Tax=Jeotgalibacillus proteolyticus TaxID=2082395 RepID=A0A2S5GF11_9BACL|nr:Holliday junction branch migration protein RuvA [Jeotgalibacillus proteolyticus]PPA71528.1 Holliday junction branch migration protein RuvA [Jeotgalibacillus proteolyticus]